MRQRRWLSGCCVLMGFLNGLGVIATSKTLAQSTPSNIVPDSTLLSESSQVIPNALGLPIEAIVGGATRGINLFHSFQEFNVREGRGAYFFPETEIQNILVRVTGKNPSNILGTLGVLSDSSTNLFLMNPNGIIFGSNASLNLQGSFVTTTANAIGFGNDNFFSASNPQFPSSLLTINPSALLFNQITKASIENRSDGFGLDVPNGKSLILVGGDVRLNGGNVTLFGGRVELGGLTAPGIVALKDDGSRLSVQFPNGVMRGDVSLTRGARVNALANGSSIAVNAKNLDISGESFLQVAIIPEINEVNSQAGNIEVNAQESVNLQNRSFIANLVFPSGIGKAGDVNISTNALTLQNGSQVTSGTRGNGDAGSVIINAKELVWLDSSAAFSTVGQQGTGNAKDIQISTDLLLLTNDAQIISSTNGKGNAGNVVLNADESILFNGSGIFSTVEFNAVGNGGNISISGNVLSLSNKALITTLSRGLGSAGNINIEAQEEVSLIGSTISSGLESNILGKSGDIRISTNSLFLSLTVQD